MQAFTASVPLFFSSTVTVTDAYVPIDDDADGDADGGAPIDSLVTAEFNSGRDTLIDDEKDTTDDGDSSVGPYASQHLRALRAATVSTLLNATSDAQQEPHAPGHRWSPRGKSERDARPNRRRDGDRSSAQASIETSGYEGGVADVDDDQRAADHALHARLGLGSLSAAAAVAMAAPVRARKRKATDASGNKESVATQPGFDGRVGRTDGSVVRASVATSVTSCRDISTTDMRPQATDTVTVPATATTAASAPASRFAASPSPSPPFAAVAYGAPLAPKFRTPPAEMALFVAHAVTNQWQDALERRIHSHPQASNYTPAIDMMTMQHRIVGGPSDVGAATATAHTSQPAPPTAITAARAAPTAAAAQQLRPQVQSGGQPLPPQPEQQQQQLALFHQWSSNVFSQQGQPRQWSNSAFGLSASSAAQRVMANNSAAPNADRSIPAKPASPQQVSSPLAPSSHPSRSLLGTPLAAPTAMGSTPVPQCATTAPYGIFPRTLPLAASPAVQYLHPNVIAGPAATGVTGSPVLHAGATAAAVVAAAQTVPIGVHSRGHASLHNRKQLWTPAEDDALRAAHAIELAQARRARGMDAAANGCDGDGNDGGEDDDDDVAISWNRVSQRVPNRSGRQCRERWVHYVAPGVHETTGAWTPAEDATIARAVVMYGRNWVEVARHLPGRTDHAVKNRYWATCRRLERAQRRTITATSFAVMPGAPLQPWLPVQMPATAIPAARHAPSIVPLPTNYAAPTGV